MSLDETKALARAAIGMWSPGELNRAGEICGSGYVMRQHHDWDVMGMLQQLGAIPARLAPA
jgi:hypothetical protein